MEKTLNRKIFLFFIPMITSQIIFDIEIALRQKIYLAYLLLVLISIYLNTNSLNSEKINTKKSLMIPLRNRELIIIPFFIIAIPIYTYIQSFYHLIPLSGDYPYHSSSMQHFNGVFSQTIRGVPLQLFSLSFLILLLIYIYSPRISRIENIFIHGALIFNLLVILYLSLNVHLVRYRYPAQIYFFGSLTEKIFKIFSDVDISGESLYYYQTLKLTNLIIFGIFTICLVWINRNNNALIFPAVTILLGTNYFIFYLNSSYLDIASLLLIILSIFYHRYSGDFKLVYYYLALSLATMFKEYGIIAIFVSSLLFVIYKKYEFRLIALYSILSCLPYVTLYTTQTMSTNEYIRPFSPSLPTTTYWFKWFNSLSLLGLLFIIFLIFSFFSLIFNIKKNTTIQISFLFTTLSILLFSVDITNKNNMGYSRFYLPLIVFIFFSFLVSSETAKIKNYKLYTHIISLVLLISITYTYPTNQSAYNFMEYTYSPVFVPKYSVEKTDVDLNIPQVWNQKLINGEAFSIRCENTDGEKIVLLYRKINYLAKSSTVKPAIEEVIARDSRYESCILDQSEVYSETKILYFDENILIFHSEN
tara:strand:- start:284 stop:2044 length:1761 start_codon:yes stop_codon:yes gene_type:complete